ncbi:unnamed protein product [Rotaria sordida]|uniref:NAD(P)(+)--arginine ADP-ribosyltransferase n=1 Tax=Rotaria sordida TaxID=392033 RepID=A0A819GQT2_9BILA|nr:unnamed protein product [Rotaria sordida]CAF0908507.1 unnamed protein product [Rotaria sordida]CAF3807332.1 unnamed protein product [Rotaria sordida]CAF3887463.1 unnamed protein product [Rotaria sordida]
MIVIVGEEIGHDMTLRIHDLSQEYAYNESIRRTIDDFEQNYDDEFAVWWYTRDTFIYRQLNKALRIENIDWLFHFRFFIRAIYNLLNELQQEQQNSSSIEHVYRGQLMSSNEIVQLKNSIGGLISFNSFLSTSRDRNHTLFLLGDRPAVSGDLHPILFEIEANYRLVNVNKPFADITSMSAFADGEQETLFMIGSVFRLERTFMEDNVTVFTMSLCSEDDQDLRLLFEHMKNEIGIGIDDTLLTLGTLLWKSGRFEQAEQFYRRMLNELASDDQLVQNCYQGLGFIATAQGDYDTSLMWQTKILEDFQHKLPSTDYRIGCTWNTIGNTHWRAKRYALALHAYNTAVLIFGPHHDRDTSACLNNMGNVYEETGQYEKALEHHLKSIEILEGILPPNHLELGTSHHNIANVYRRLHKFDSARSHIKRALHIFQKSLRANDPSIAATYQTMGALEFDVGAYREGLKYLEQSAAIYRETLPSDHPTVEAIHTTIAQAIKAMLDYDLNYL